MTTLNWSSTEFNQIAEDVLREVSVACPRIVVETLATVEDDRTLDISSIEDLLDGARSIIKCEYETDSYPRNYHNVTVIDDDTIEMDIDTAPDADDEDVYVWCEKMHTLTNATSTLTPKLEGVLLKGVEAYGILQRCHTMRDNLNDVDTLFTTVGTTIGLMTARITTAAGYVTTNAAAAAGKIDALLTAAAGEIAKITTEVAQAVADLDSGRALIATQAETGNPVAEYASYAARGVDNAIGYMRSAQGHLQQAQGDGSAASVFSTLSGAELRAAAADLQQAQGYLSQIAQNHQAVQAIKLYEQTGNQKLALYKKELASVTVRRATQRYPKS